ncbi:uncharacterized protein LOC113761511 [Coffea eugenioides]|uniref:uncharacterized protein LOC113761464 n=1 Tax=Coffea eugenioides TaxID=49369 RepID=UPI000F60866E|nr:uncharacterized protein LOC113761464 [Coffea eugenioides]XP_027160331.1 uncharacterized protein LOC113761511 [Coffea eugenioides]
MSVVAFCFQSSIFHLSSFSALSKSEFFPLKVKEFTDGPLLFASNRDIYYPVVSSKQADGDRKGVSPHSPGLGRIPKGDENKENQSSRNREEIISLFRRIQSSISKGSANSKKRSSQPSEDGSSADSVLEVLRQSRTKGKTATKDGDKILARQRGSLRKEQKANYSSVVDSKLTRPPSTFVRRSPIPLSNRGVPADLRSDQVPAADYKKETEIPELKGLALQKVEDMKLPELKELAKSKGIKGYSKLRKAELVKLLITS